MKQKIIMVQPKEIVFTYQEIVECLLKKQNIHEGLWGLRIGFGLGASNVSMGNEDAYVPAAIVPVTEIGIQRFEKPSNLTVDAASVNPSHKSKENSKKKQAVLKKSSSKTK